MPLYLTEEEVRDLLTMEVALERLEAVFKDKARGRATNQPRSRIPTGRGMYNLMSAAWHEKSVVGQKSYVGGRGGVTFHVLLYSTAGEGLLAIFEASRLGQIRTGAASGLASKYMAKPSASSVAVLGSGYQARTQLEAVATALPSIKSTRVFSRTQERREIFAREVGPHLGIEVAAADSVETCIDGADIIIVITNAAEPVLNGELLQEGVHINAAGANSWMRRELDTRAVAAANVVVTDDVEQAKIECADLMRAYESGRLSWDRVVPLDRVVSGEAKGRRGGADITLFESQGVALEDIAVAEWLYQEAKKRGIGIEIGK